MQANSGGPHQSAQMLVRSGPFSLHMPAFYIMEYRIYPAIRQGFCPSRMTSNN